MIFFGGQFISMTFFDCSAKAIHFSKFCGIIFTHKLLLTLDREFDFEIKTTLEFRLRNSHELHIQRIHKAKLIM